MKKRFLGVLLSVAMVAAVLAGCGSSGAKETAAPAGSETEAASEAASGETEAAGNTGDVITVGFSQVGAESDWRTANSESMKSTFSTENGYNLIFDDAQQTGEFTQAKGQEVMESMLKQYDNINVVYCENDNEAFGAIEAIKAAGKTVGPDGDILVMSFDTTKQGITDTLSGDIIVNTECNPLHGPRVEQIIKQLQAGETPEKQAYVEEGIYAYGSDVPSVSIDGTDYEVTEVTQDVVDARAY